MRKALGPILASLALVAAMGFVHGVYTDRWGRSAQLEQALAALPRVPATVGDWVGEDRAPLTDAVKRAGGIDGFVVREYRNPRTGDSVTFLLVCGRGGPISVHTPDVCFEGAGHRQLAPEKPQTIDADGRAGTFNVARFATTDVVPTHMEAFWGWSTDGQTWQAPDNPRASLARSRALYKLYVVRRFPVGSPQEKEKTCEDFLRRALPELRQALAPTAG